MAAAAKLLKDDPVFTVAREQARRDKRTRRMENRWASFEVGFGTSQSYDTVARMLSGFVGCVISLGERRRLSRDVRLLDAGQATGAVRVIDVNDDGVDMPGTNADIPYEEIIDILVY